MILGGAAAALTTKIRQVIAAGKSAASCANMRRYAHAPAAGAGRRVLARPRRACRPLAVAQDDGWLSDGRCRLATDSLPAAYARCGTLEVPLDPAAPDGPKVELFVARLGALQRRAAARPAAPDRRRPRPEHGRFLSAAARRVRARAPRPRHHPRRPARHGPLGRGLRLRRARRSVARYGGGPTSLNRVIDACVAELDHDPRFYTTSVAVQDLERVRAALGIEQWNVYGVSYGTRVAQHYLRRYPDARALASCSTASCRRRSRSDPTSRARRSARSSRSSRAARPTRSAARGSPRCRSCSRKCSTRLDAGAAEETDPPPISALELRTLVRFMSYSAATVALLPVLISEAHAGNYAPLAGQARTLLRELPESLSFPMSNSVMCAEDAPYVADAATGGLDATYLGHRHHGRHHADLRPLARRPHRRRLQDARRQRHARAALVRRVRSDHPARLCGARARPTGLRNSVHLIGRGQGHGLIGVGCVPRMLRSFLERARAGRARRELPRARAADAVLLELARARAMIEVDGISKRFGTVRAVEGVSFKARGRPDHGAARAERRRQVDVPAHPVDGAASRTPARPASAASISRPDPLAARRTLGVLPHSSGLYQQLTGAREHRVLRAFAWHGRGAARGARRRA